MTTVSNQKTSRRQGAYVIKAAETRPPRERTPAARTTEPTQTTSADQRAARAITRHQRSQ